MSRAEAVRPGGYAWYIPGYHRNFTAISPNTGSSAYSIYASAVKDATEGRHPNGKINIMYADGHDGDLTAAQMVDGKGPPPQGGRCEARKRFRAVLWYDMPKWWPASLTHPSGDCPGASGGPGEDCYEEP